ncbi:unnamed protein product [Chondrus crispus]|uniref:Uncharacterized protein n=1 Tax=Chondrus crispus TaxID=2769 RepID=R7QM76_CHOCR|nr:unnamed protein product [Chondrus crispus]CDF39607.1 unnamed protein product [Chondrus crispus]|eukprot:XP_005709901.1 unnamed protein product [Chondrus crispus]
MQLAVPGVKSVYRHCCFRPRQHMAPTFNFREVLLHTPFILESLLRTPFFTSLPNDFPVEVHSVWGFASRSVVPNLTTSRATRRSLRRCRPPVFAVSSADLPDLELSTRSSVWQ